MDRDFYDLLRKELIRDEGLKLSAYQDSEGYWTIGVGRLIDSRRGGKITEAEAAILLTNDICSATLDLDRNLPWWRKMTDARQRALANLCFALGIVGLKGFTRMLAALEGADYKTAARECLDSKWAGQVGDRAQRIATLFREG